MIHRDKFDRVWRYKPDHDTDRMLQISDAVASIGYNANYALCNGEAENMYAGFEQPLEPYLLKMHSGWVMGMRYGDEGWEYISPGLDSRIIEMMVELHGRLPQSRNESNAIWALAKVK